MTLLKIGCYYSRYKKIFGLEISKLVDGVTKLTKIELKFGLAQAENFRKL